MTHRHFTGHSVIFLLLAGVIMGLSLSACNQKDDDLTDESTYVSSESVAVTAFSLAADLRVMQNLDSVFFSIDLEHGVIFNADSLPKGTNITKLMPKISYPSSVKSAVIEMSGGSHREGTVNYYVNPNDTIDFSGNVTLTLGTADNAITKTYTLKVNVHQEDPDTIYWDRMATIDLPSMNDNPYRQKTVKYKEGVLTMIEEYGSTYTCAYADNEDLFEGVWNWTEPAGIGATPLLIRSLTATPDGKLFVINQSCELWTSDDAKRWEKAADNWIDIIGMYGDTLLGVGVTSGSDRNVMKSYPAGAFPEIYLPDDFPTSDRSAAIEITNRWASTPTIVVFGGSNYDDADKSPSWAFDGTQWVNIAETPLPPLRGLSVMKYYSYLKSASNGILKEFEILLAFGGRDASGAINNTIYMSYDYGINWQRAPEYMQFPEGVMAGYDVDAIAIGTTLESNLSNRWKSLASKRRLPFEIDGDLVKWECPYIFLFGGLDQSETLYRKVRSGVLQRLTFEPLF